MIGCVTGQLSEGYLHPELGTLDATTRIFPGAEGHGTQSPGGRGGQVIPVDNSAELIAALQTSGPRNIVFKTGGVYELTDEVSWVDPFYSIYGQTAPGDGVEIRGNEVAGNMLIANANDGLIQHLKLRIGPFTNPHSSASNNLQVRGKRVTVDHCDMSFSMDQIMNTSRFGNQADEVTLSYNLFAEPLHSSYATDTFNTNGSSTHGFGPLLWGATDAKGSYHHNIISQCNRRGPSFGWYSVWDSRNNLMYNHAAGTFFGYIQSANHVGNFYIDGPDSGASPRDVIVADQAFNDGNDGFAQPPGIWPVNSNTIYVADNLRENVAGAVSVARYGNYVPGLTIQESDITGTEVACPLVTTVPASQVEALLLAEAGAKYARDAISSRQLADIAARAGQWIDCAGGRSPAAWNSNCARSVPWPNLPTVVSSDWDTNQPDCVPNQWKRDCGGAAIHGDNYDTTQQDSNGDGYTDFEDYINQTFGF